MNSIKYTLTIIFGFITIFFCTAFTAVNAASLIITDGGTYSFPIDLSRQLFNKSQNSSNPPYILAIAPDYTYMRNLEGDNYITFERKTIDRYIAIRVEGSIDNIISQGRDAANFLEDNPDFLPGVKRHFFHIDWVPQTGIKYESDYDPATSFDQILGLFPQIDTIAVTYLSGPTTTIGMAFEKVWQEKYASKFNFVKLDLALPTDEYQRIITSLPPSSAVISVIDTPYDKNHAWLMASKNLPVFSTFDIENTQYLGGTVISASKMANLIYRLSQGEHVDPNSNNVLEYQYNYDVLKYFNQHGSVLQKDATIFNQPQKTLTFTELLLSQLIILTISFSAITLFAKKKITLDLHVSAKLILMTCLSISVIAAIMNLFTPKQTYHIFPPLYGWVAISLIGIASLIIIEKVNYFKHHEHATRASMMTVIIMVGLGLFTHTQVKLNFSSSQWIVLIVLGFSSMIFSLRTVLIMWLTSNLTLSSLFLYFEPIAQNLTISVAYSLLSLLFIGFLYNLNQRKEQFAATIIENLDSIREAKAEAEIANHAKTTFINNLSHELRTPLNGILNLSKFISDEHKDAKENAKLGKNIHASGLHMLNILNDVLDSAKIASGKFTIEKTHFDLAVSLNNIASMVETNITNKGLTFSFSHALGDHFYTKGDPTRITQVLYNFLSNATKFTPSGSISLKVFTTIKGQVRFEVLDTGIGIAENRLQHVFEKFTQVETSTARLYGGTGLGLSICQSLVTLMGGQIGVMSEPGFGSTFWFELPLIELSARKVDAQQLANMTSLPHHKILKTAIPSGAKLENILIVDDVHTNLYAMELCIEKTLGHGNYTLFQADSPQQALDILSAKEIDLLITDINMPLMSGIAMTRVIRDNESGISQDLIIIAASGIDDTDEINNAIKSGMNGFIKKPVSPDEIKELFEEIANHKAIESTEETTQVTTVDYHKVITQPSMEFLDRKIELLKVAVEKRDTSAVRKIGLKLNTLGTLLNDKEIKACANMLANMNENFIDTCNMDIKALERRAHVLNCHYS